MEIKINKQFLYPENKPFEDELILSFKFDSKSNQEYDLPIEEFTWFLSLFSNNSYFPYYHRIFDERFISYKRLYKESFFPIRNGIKIKNRVE